ncbi:MAG: hypothetical protein EFT35_09945 [Methanophagales archaeon ANME-1-THS]|nr:MAG: hypothetical protein EFT35_09945 [Methanophagales archaeon ANME-1-THS]
MKKLKRCSILFISLLLFSVGIGGAVASPFQNITRTPLFIQFFLLVNIFQLSVAITMIREVKKASPSKVWDNIYTGNFLNMLMVVGLTLILNKQYNILAINILVPIALSYSFAVFMLNVVIYLLIKPLLGEKLSLIKKQYILFYMLLSTIILYSYTTFIQVVKFPSIQFILSLYFFLAISAFIILYCTYYFLVLSKEYSNIGFVSRPALCTGIGLILIFICSIIISSKSNFYTDYYYLVAWFIPVTFAVLYYLRMGIEYPSVLTPKWKAYLPYDVIKIYAAATLAFLSISFFFTVMEHGDSSFISLLKDIPHPFFILLIFPLSAIVLIFVFTKALSSKTKLRYWNYLSYGLYIHILATVYVLCLAFLLWSGSSLVEKLIFSAIFALASAFYLFYALDMRIISRGVGITPVFDKIEIATNLISLTALFFIILFSISFTYKKDLHFFESINFEAYPFMILFILSAIAAFITFLKVSKESFEELMRKNIWSRVSYFASFATAFYVYLIFRIKPELQDFPLRDLFFIAYLAALLIDILSARTLMREKGLVKGEIEGAKKKKVDISDLLNLYADKFFRVDYLEDLWEKTRDTYVLEHERAAIRFDPAERTFHLENLDEPTKLKVAVGMLIGMHGVSDMEQATLLKKSKEETKDEIMHALEEKVLMLPDELRCEFDEEVYYPLLFKRVINDLLIPLKTFIPLTDQAEIFERLKKRDEHYGWFCFETGEIQLKEGARFDRGIFVKLFRLYLEAVEERFPFKRLLLYEMLRDEIKKVLAPYAITISELLDVVPTGIEEMDGIMSGGLLRGTTTLLITEETKAKQEFLFSFIKKGLIEGNNAIYATSKLPYQHILGGLLVDGGDFKKLMLIDLYESLYTENPRSELAEEDHRLIVPFSKIQFQRSIVKAIKSLPRESAKIVVIDIYDDFSKYFGSKDPFELLQRQVEGLKRWNCTSIIAIDPSSYLIKKEGVDEVKKHFDNILILSGGDKNAAVFIEKLYHGTPAKPVIRLVS